MSLACAHTHERERTPISLPSTESAYHRRESWRVHFILRNKRNHFASCSTRLAPLDGLVPVHVSGSNFINDTVNGLKIFEEAKASIAMEEIFPGI